MNARLKSFAIISVLALLGAASVSAAQETNKQEPAKQGNDQPFKLSVGTNLVLVPVIVTDKRGEHVSGLTAADFEVKEEGSLQKIVRLDEFTAETSKVQKPPAAAKTFTNRLVAEHPKKLEIIALDQVNTPFANARDGHRMLVEFLSKTADANTLLALVAMQHNGVRIIHDFTSDPSILAAAVKKVQYSISSRDTRTLNAPGDSSEADLEALQIAALLNGADLSSATSANQLAAAARAAVAQARAQVDASRQAQEGLITLEDFQQLAQYFGGVPGRKSLIWASTGFPFSLGAPAQSTTRGTIDDDWQRTLRMLTDANIAVYPVDIGGLLPGVSANTIASINSAAVKTGGAEGGVGVRSGQMEALDSGAFVDPTTGRHDTMHQLADRTGGEAFYNSNDGADLFRRAGDDSAQYYVLAYHTKDNGKYGWRKLSVKVNRNDVRVRARSGFFFNDPKKEADPSKAVKDLKIAMTSDLPFTSIPLSGQWQQVEQAGDQRKIHFMLSVPPGVAFIDSEHQNHISLEFLVVATDRAGKNVANISQRLDTKLPPEGVAQIQEQGMDYANALTLPPSDYTVHFVVRDNLKGTLGSMVTPLKVE
jgi:VWFA-related protein